MIRRRTYFTKFPFRRLGVLCVFFDMVLPVVLQKGLLIIANFWDYCYSLLSRLIVDIIDECVHKVQPCPTYVSLPAYFEVNCLYPPTKASPKLTSSKQHVIASNVRCNFPGIYLPQSCTLHNWPRAFANLQIRRNGGPLIEVDRLMCVQPGFLLGFMVYSFTIDTDVSIS